MDLAFHKYENKRRPEELNLFVKYDILKPPIWNRLHISPLAREPILSCQGGFFDSQRSLFATTQHSLQAK